MTFIPLKYVAVQNKIRHKPDAILAILKHKVSADRNPRWVEVS